MPGKINVICCGGAGINIGDKVINMVGELGDGFAEVAISYVDTSRANIDKIQPRGKFWHVATKSHNKDVIDGAGSERQKLSADIIANVSEYLDSNKILKHINGEYYMVIFSASGGSGSVIAPMMIKGLLERNIPTIAVVVGDSSNGLSAANTLKTLATLQVIATKVSKPLSMLYVNNAAVNDKNMMVAEDKANQMLLNTISTISLFLSGQNEALDNQDMTFIIDQSNLTSLNIAPGLYGLIVSSKDPILPADSIPTVARTLTVGNIPYDINNLTLLHHKRGYVTNENAASLYKSQFPIHLISFANIFTVEEKSLKAVNEHYRNIMDNITIKSISVENGILTDDGIVF